MQRLVPTFSTAIFKNVPRQSGPWHFLLITVGILALFFCMATPFSYADDVSSPDRATFAYRTAADRLPAGTVNPGKDKDESTDDSIVWIKNATRQYSPVSWSMLMQYENLPQELEGFKKGGWKVSMKKTRGTFQNLEEGKTRPEMLASMAINISSVVLALQRFEVIRHTRTNNLLMDWDKAEVFLYLSPDQAFFVSFPIRSLFPSVHLAAEIPESARTSLFDMYIRECKSTQRFGVIGLLEEFHSFYFQSRFYLDMLEAYKIARASEAEGFLEWIKHSQSAMNALYEFDFFILEYLLYMKTNRASDYEALRNHKPFAEAYAAIRGSYEALVGQYALLIRKQMEDLNGSGKAETGMEGDVVWIKTAGSDIRKGAKVLPYRDKLLPVITGSRYQSVLSDYPRM